MNLNGVYGRVKNKNTMFLAWMEANKKYEQGRSLTYVNFPSTFVYDSSLREWKLRQRGNSVGRLSFIPPSCKELFYMRLLLNVQVGCTSYSDLKKVGGHQYFTFREACAALGLVGDDREFIDGINEIALLGSGFALRRAFVSFLLSNSMSDPLWVWEETWETLSDGILYQRRCDLHNPGLFFPFFLC